MADIKLSALGAAATLTGVEVFEALQAGANLGPTITQVAAYINSSGTGSPEGAVARPPGCHYWQTDTGTDWVKNTGTGNTGWLDLVTR